MPAKKKSGDRIFVAKENFTTELADGTPVVVRAGIDRVREGHELLQGREMFFEELTVQYDVEDATAEPGRTRGQAA